MKAKLVVLGATAMIAVGLIGFGAGVSVGQGTSPESMSCGRTRCCQVGCRPFTSASPSTR